MSNVKVWTLHLEDGYFVPDVELRDNENMVCVIKKADHETTIAEKDARIAELESANEGLKEVLKYIGTGLDPRTVHYSEVFEDEVVKPFNNMRSMSEYAFECLAKFTKGEK